MRVFDIDRVRLRFVPESRMMNDIAPEDCTVDTNHQPLPLPGKLQLLATEIETYYRELPRLLDEGAEGRVALIRGKEVSVWDTTDDALQHAAVVYGLVPFIAQPIDGRDIERLAPYMAMENLPA